VGGLTGHGLAEPDDATPLTEAERRGLLVPALSRAELNLVEAENITKAVAWLFLSRRRIRVQAVTDEEWLKRLHRRMYGDVWAWAGRYRTADRNLGVPHWHVPVEMRVLIEDVTAWLSDTGASRYSTDECAIRFGYRLVVIHPFANGNGRWSRLAADALAVALGGARFTWGGASLTAPGTLRGEYLTALRTADSADDLGPLLTFARS
jgi:Fic-DOC domain mobile mystery protein B